MKLREYKERLQKRKERCLYELERFTKITEELDKENIPLFSNDFL